MSETTALGLLTGLFRTWSTAETWSVRRIHFSHYRLRDQETLFRTTAAVK